MSPARKTTFKCAPIADLYEQLRYTPPETLAKQIQRAEALHDTIQDELNYPADFLLYRITGFRRDTQPTNSTLLVGQAIRPDLRLLIDQLSQHAPLPHTNERTTQQLADQFNVSTKTIERWRKAGLRWRWLTPPPPAPPASTASTPGSQSEATANKSRPFIGFTPEAIQHFQAQSTKRIDQASDFTQLTAAQRDRLIHRARRLANHTDTTPNQIAIHLARRSSRAIETLRQLFTRHDQANPQQPIFANRDEPLNPADYRRIYQDYRSGIKRRHLCEKYQRTPTTIYRAINLHRLTILQRLPITYITSQTFDRPEAEDIYLRPTLPPDTPDHSPATQTDDLPDILKTLYDRPVPNNEHLRIHLIRFNYLKYAAHTRLQAINTTQPRKIDLDQIEAFYRQAGQRRDIIFHLTLPLVLSVARRQLLEIADPQHEQLLHLLIRGNDTLITALDQYDPFRTQARTQSFSAYLRNRLLQHFTTTPRTKTTIQNTLARQKAHRRRDDPTLLQELQAAAAKRHIQLTIKPKH